ncbi:MAG: winged helix-turn-helix domain-containing protein [Pseudomonadota bacterium]
MSGCWQVGAFTYDPAAAELRQERRRRFLRPQPAALLDLLLENADEVVSRSRIRAALWPAEAVLEFDPAINACIKQLRRQLGDSATEPTYIQTIPKRGYRLLAEVRRLEGEPATEAAVESNSKAEPRSAPRRSVTRGPVLVFSALVALALIAALLVPRLREHTGGGAAPVRAMLVVMPFDAPSTAQDFDRGIEFADRLIAKLGGASPDRLGVIARTTAEALGGSSLTAAQIGDRLHADYLIEGSVRPAGELLFVSVTLVRVDDQSFVWGELVETAPEPRAMEQTVAYIADAVLSSVLPEAALESLPPLLRVDRGERPEDPIALPEAVPEH